MHAKKTLQILKAIMKAADKGGRPHLTRAKVARYDGRTWAAATDGHRLLVAVIDGPDVVVAEPPSVAALLEAVDAYDAFLPLEGVEALARAMGARDSLEIDGDKATAGHTTVALERGGPRFPTLSYLLQGAGPGAQSAAIDPAYLADACASIGSKGEPMIACLTGSLSAAWLLGPRGLYVVMPMREETEAFAGQILKRAKASAAA